MTITPFLWFDTQAEEAMTYYLSVFQNGKTKAVHRARSDFRFDEQHHVFVPIVFGQVQQPAL